MLYQETMHGTKDAADFGPARFPSVALEFKVNRLGILFHALWWFIGLVLVSFVFLYPSFSGMMPVLDQNPFALVQDYGNAAYVGLGVVIVALFSIYLAVLLRPVFTRGPLYKVDIRGIQFNQADAFTVPPSAIDAVFLTYSHGMATGVLLEIPDRQRLIDLKRKLPPFAPVSFNVRDGSMTVSLAGLKKKMAFVGAIQYLVARQSRRPR